MLDLSGVIHTHLHTFFSRALALVRAYGVVLCTQGVPTGYTPVPDVVADLPFLPPRMYHVVGFKGTFAIPPTCGERVSTMVFLQIQGSHQAGPTRTRDLFCFPAFSVGDSVLVPHAPYTRASLQFCARKPSSLGARIMILNPLSLRKHLLRESAQTVKREGELLVPQAVTVSQPQNNIKHVQFFTLNVHKTITTKLQALRHFLEYHALPEVVCLQEIGGVANSY